MKEPLFFGAIVGSIVVALGRALLIDETKGRVQRRAQRRLERAIRELPPDLQAAWSVTWREQFAAIVTMPLTAAQYVRAIRRLPRSLDEAELAVERAIASLPAEQREEWADEWRAELAALAADPTRAGQFATGLQRSARGLGGSRAISVPPYRPWRSGGAAAAQDARQYREGPGLEAPLTAASDGATAVEHGFGTRLAAVTAEFGERHSSRHVSALVYIGQCWFRLPSLVRGFLVCGTSWTVLCLAEGPRVALGVMACPAIALISFHIARWFER